MEIKVGINFSDPSFIFIVSEVVFE
uniref:Uncharacterized protein n=1 Tax=Anguilla anguilla TaxID=7936 RepID=A0A0E9SQU4_ANGAN